LFYKNALYKFTFDIDIDIDIDVSPLSPAGFTPLITDDRQTTDGGISHCCAMIKRFYAVRVNALMVVNWHL